MIKSPSVFENILFYLNTLKTSQTMFDQFMAVVEEDLTIKIESLETIRLNVHLGSHRRTIVNVQIMMLKCYSSRVKSFEKVSDNSILNICEQYKKDDRDDVRIGYLVKRHIQILVKMKRRMKAILDVSEKYSVTKQLDTTNVFDAEKDDLSLSTGVKDKEDHNQVTTKFPNYRYFLYDSPSFSRIPLPLKSACSSSSRPKDQFGETPLRPLKFFSDHIFVLAKTFKKKH